MYIVYNTFKIRYMSCQGNGNCPKDNQDKLDAELKGLITKMLIDNLRAVWEGGQNRKLDKETGSPHHKEVAGQGATSQNSITEMVNNQTKFAPNLLKHRGGRASVVIQSGLTITIASIITLGATLIAASENQFIQSLLFCLALLGGIIILAGYFWDPDRTKKWKKQGDASDSKADNQQNNDKSIDKPESGGDKGNSLKVLEQKIEHMIVFGIGGTGSRKISVRNLLSFKQNEELPRIKILLIDPSCGSGSILLKENIIPQRTHLKKSFPGIMQTDFLFSLSQEKQKIDKIIINSKVVDLFNESDMGPILRSFLMLCGRGLHNSYRNERTFNLLKMKTEKEIISLINYRSSSDFDKVFKLFFQSLRKYSEKTISQSDLKMSKESRTEVNYDIYDSFQLNKEKKKTNLSIHKYLFQIPEINRLSRNSTVTKESNIPIHKFSFALQANTNQCSTEKEEKQISIFNNQKTKSNKLLRKKIKLNLN